MEEHTYIRAYKAKRSKKSNKKVENSDCKTYVCKRVKKKQKKTRNTMFMRSVVNQRQKYRKEKNPYPKYASQKYEN